MRLEVLKLKTFIGLLSFMLFVGVWKMMNANKFGNPLTILYIKNLLLQVLV